VATSDTFDAAARYRHRVLADASGFVDRLHQGKRALITFGVEQSPIDGGYYCLDVCEAIEQICRARRIAVETWRMDDIGMVFRAACAARAGYTRRRSEGKPVRIRHGTAAVSGAPPAPASGRRPSLIHRIGKARGRTASPAQGPEGRARVRRPQLPTEVPLGARRHP
jgi:hypothetical protein